MEDLSALIPAPYNPRKISNHDAKALLRSLGEFGDMGGLVNNRRTGNMVGGHQRRTAYAELGGRITITQQLDTPSASGTVAYGYVIIGDEQFTYREVDWPIEKEKLGNLAANRIQGEWDDDKLAALVYDMKDDFNLPDSGFTTNEVNELLATVMEAGEDDADITPPEPSAAVSKRGDLFKLGDHRLLCGDATSGSDLATLMGTERAEMVFTDAPYNVDYVGKTKDALKIQNDKMAAKDFSNFLFDVCKNLLQHCGGGYYICMSSSELHTLFDAFTSNGGHWQTYIIWAKNSFTLGRADYQHQFEPILYGLSEAEAKKADEDPDRQLSALPIMYGWKDKHHWYGGRKQGDVWLIDRPAKSPEHPTMKPVTLCARAIRNSSRRGEIVLDVFGGSGSTLIAAHQLQRKCYMMELDPTYCDVIIRRWEHMTGQKAELIKNIGGNDGN